MKFYDLLIEKSKEDGVEKNVVGGIVINKDNQILILTRKSDDFMGGIDELPSGNMENGEKIKEALIREVKEETNLEVVQIKSYINSFDYLSGSGKKARQYNFALEVDDIRDIKLSEHDDFKWLNIEDARNNNKITEEVKYCLEIFYFNNMEK